MKKMKFIFMLITLLFACVTFVLTSGSDLDHGINGCKSRKAYSLVFKGLCNYGEIIKCNENAAFIAGMFEIKRSRRIVSRIRNSGEKQDLILRIDKKTFENLIGLNDTKDIENEVKKIAEEYKKITNWRLFYAMLPYGAPLKIVDAFNEFKISVVSTAVKVPENMDEADVSVFTGVVIVDTKSYDFEKDHLKNFTTNTIPFGECIPRGSVALPTTLPASTESDDDVTDEEIEIDDDDEPDDLNPSSAPETFTLLLKGGLKHLDVIKLYDRDSAIVVTLDDLSKQDVLVRAAINEGRKFVISISKNELSDFDAIFNSFSLIAQASTKYGVDFNYVILPKNLDTETRESFTAVNEGQNISVLEVSRHFNFSEGYMDNISTQFNFAKIVLVNLEAKITEESANTDKKVKVKMTPEDAFTVMRVLNAKIDNQERAPLSLDQFLNGAVDENLPEAEKIRQLYLNFYSGISNPRIEPVNIELEINRQNLYTETIDRFNGIFSNSLRQSPIHIEFTGEEGRDSGGLRKDWNTDIMKEIFNPDKNLFLRGEGQDQNTFHPNPNSRFTDSGHLNDFRFAGRFIAKSLIDKIPIGNRLSLALCKLILGRSVALSDLKEIDHQTRDSLANLAADSENSLLEYYNFSISVQQSGKSVTIDLKTKKAGNDDDEYEEVTPENKFEFVYLKSQYIIYDSCKEQIDAFLDGFHQVIPQHMLASFSPKQLQNLISGISKIDVEDWKMHTQYTGQHGETSNEIIWFWEVVGSMSDEEKRKLLHFATGSSGVPYGGFSQLLNKNEISSFKISHLNNSRNGLPQGRTCFNRIDLPFYDNKNLLSEKLLYAINEGNSAVLLE